MAFLSLHELCVRLWEAFFLRVQVRGVRWHLAFVESLGKHTDRTRLSVDGKYFSDVKHALRSDDKTAARAAQSSPNCLDLPPLPGHRNRGRLRYSRHRAPESCNRIMELELFSTIAPRNYRHHPEGVSLTTIAKSYVTKTLVYKTFSVFSKEKEKNRSSWFRILVSHTNTRPRQANLSMGSLERVSKPCIYALLRWWKSQQKTKIKILEFVY